MKKDPFPICNLRLHSSKSLSHSAILRYVQYLGSYCMNWYLTNTYDLIIAALSNKGQADKNLHTTSSHDSLAVLAQTITVSSRKLNEMIRFISYNLKYHDNLN